MKNLFKLKSIALILFTSAIVGCSSDNNEDIFVGNETEFDGELTVFSTGGDNRNVLINANNVTTSTASVRVAFTSEEPMRRLYVTRNTANSGAVPFDFAVSGVTVDDKKDGSLDLSSDNRNAFEFVIPFPVPTSDDSNIVYTLWATTGRGDFRDISKRNAIGEAAIGTITITGSGSFMANGISSFTQTLLEAPLADGTSDTFISLFNGEVYKISDGEEFAALWDFGYFFGNTNRASLASASNYPSNIVNIPTISGVAQEELNSFFLAKSTLTSADFDAVTSASDLSTIATPTSERVTQLAEGDIVEIEDQYGNKGLLRVTDITGTDGSSGAITFDVKIQN